MKPLLIALVATTVLSACTIEQKDGELQSEFHPPLIYAQWQTENYKTPCSNKRLIIACKNNQSQ